MNCLLPIMRKLIILSIFLGSQWLASQGFYNQENFGNQSILLSGNVTGSVEDLGLTYYNPARIALVESPVFAINAKAFQLNSLSLKNAFGNDKSLNDSEFEGVPSLVAGTFSIEKWEKHHFAYAFISKIRKDFGFNISREIDLDEINDEFENIERLTGTLNLTTKERDDWFGATWGMKIHENFSIGVSTFVSVYSFRELYDTSFASLDQNQNVDIFNSQIKITQYSYGVFTKLGLAWKLNKIDLGLNIDLPYLEVVKSGSFRYQRNLSGTDDGSDEFEYYDYKDLESDRKEPLGISLGIGVPWGKNMLHFKTDWHGSLSEYERLTIPDLEDGTEGFAFKEERRSVINFGLGAEFYLNDGMNLYASFSTDFSPIEANASIFDIIGGEEPDTDANFDADYFHYGFGMQFKLKKVDLVVGTTYTIGSADFGEPIDIPLPEAGDDSSDDLTKIVNSRWRFIIGLQIPIFGYDVDIR